MVKWFQDEESVATTTHFSSGDTSTVDKYTQFLFLLVSSILALAAVMCVARIIFVYCSYKRRRNEERQRRTQTQTVSLEAALDHAFSLPPGLRNFGFTADPPPRYEQLFKRDEPPPVYESVRRPQRNQASSTVLTDSAPVTANNQQQTANGRRPRSAVEADGTDRSSIADVERSTSTDIEEPTSQDIGTLSQEIQTHMDTAHQRYHEDPAGSSNPPTPSSPNGEVLPS